MRVSYCKFHNNCRDNTKTNFEPKAKVSNDEVPKSEDKNNTGAKKTLQMI